MTKKIDRTVELVLRLESAARMSTGEEARDFKDAAHRLGTYAAACQGFSKDLADIAEENARLAAEVARLREAAFSLWLALCEADGRNEMCAALSKVAGLFVEPRAVPSITECVDAFESVCYDHESKRDRRAGVESVRALCIGEQGDGASVPGDSGLKAGHNMERGSGCPASDHHADRETSTPQGPKDPAPSPAPAAPFAPDREALAKWKSVCEAAHKEIDRVCTERWRMSIPVDRERDSDMILSGALDKADYMIDALLAERDALRKELAERCDQVDALQHERDKIMVRLGNACQPFEIEDRIRGLQQRAGERDALQAEVEKLRRERDGWMPLNRRLIEHRIEAEKERDTALARVRELEEASKIASDVYAAAQKVGEHLARTTGVVLAGKTYDHAVNAALDRIKELEGAGIDVEACIREVRETPWTFAVQQRHRDEIVLSIASILRKHARPAKRSVTREEVESIVYDYEINGKTMMNALAAIGIEVVT